MVLTKTMYLSTLILLLDDLDDGRDGILLQFEARLKKEEEVAAAAVAAEGGLEDDEMGNSLARKSTAGERR